MISDKEISTEIPIYVINLDSATERFNTFKSQELLKNRHFNRWSATSGSDLDSSKFGIEESFDGILITGFREWSKNEAACGVSHIKILQEMIRKDIPWIIVLEDDAIIKYPIPSSIEEFNVPKDAEIVLLNARSLGSHEISLGDKFSYGEVIGGAGTDGYLISLSGAKKILKVLYPLNDPLDFQMYSHFESIQKNDKMPFYWKLPQNSNAKDILLKAYRIFPALVDQADVSSTIGGQRHPRARYYCRVLLNMDLPELNNYYTKLTLPINDKTDIPPKKEKIEYKGVDISHIDESLKYYKIDGVKDECPMAILKHYGINLVRISVWVDPGSVMNIERALRLAKEANNVGLKIYLVLHYSDSWADPTHQSKPKLWEDLSFEELCCTIYEYTSHIIDLLLQQDTPPEIIQIGNEVTNGFLWATKDQSVECSGQLCENDNSSWIRFSKLVNCASKAIRDAECRYKVDIKAMLQIDKGAYPEIAVWWFDRARMYDIDYDIIGLSYYYLWHNATIDELSRLSCLEITFPDKYIMIAETSYPYRHGDGITMMPLYNNPPYTPSGQKDYISAIRQSINELTNGCGFCWWGAFFLNDKYDHIEDLFRAQALFDEHGVALESISAFE